MSVTTVCSSTKELDQDTQLALSYLLEAMQEENLDYRVFETYRSQQRQDYLYAQGRTAPGEIVTWTRDSIHIKRRAVDIIHKTLLWNAPNTFWKRLAELAKEVGFTAGYYWTKNQDKPHIQLPLGVTPKRIIRQKEDYMIKEIEIAINGKITKVPAVEIEGRTYPQLAALAKTGDLIVSYNGMPLLDFAKSKQAIQVDNKILEVDIIKVADRNFIKVSDLNQSDTIKVSFENQKPTIKTKE